MTNLLTVDSLQDDINEENAQALTDLALKSPFNETATLIFQSFVGRILNHRPMQIDVSA